MHIARTRQAEELNKYLKCNTLELVRSTESTLTLKLTTSTMTVNAVMPGIRKVSLFPESVEELARVNRGSAEIKVDSTSAAKIQPQNTNGCKKGKR